MLPTIAMVSTYPPTHCGIATFTKSLSNAIAHAGSHVGIIDLGPSRTPDNSVSVLHRHTGPETVEATARLLNSFDVVILQHEFGIWDGDDGAGIIDLLANIAVPVITVVHTVPQTATGGQRRVMQSLLDLSDSVVALSYSAEVRLRKTFTVRRDTLEVIPHGATQLWRSRSTTDDTANPRFLTWGLLGKGKGIEWGIAALAHLATQGHRPEYVIAGATHPKVKAAEGEAYRESLQEMAANLGVDDQVTFVDAYLDEARLTDLVRSSTAFLLPYDSRDQITSGVLVEAIAAGGPVIATRFPHAVELLGNGAGKLVDHRDAAGIARAITSIIEDPQQSHRMRLLSAGISQAFSWDSVADRYVNLADALWRRRSLSNRLQTLFAESAAPAMRRPA